jgi:hypothetical protein
LSNLPSFRKRGLNGELFCKKYNIFPIYFFHRAEEMAEKGKGPMRTLFSPFKLRDAEFGNRISLSQGERLQPIFHGAARNPCPGWGDMLQDTLIAFRKQASEHLPHS